MIKSLIKIAKKFDKKMISYLLIYPLSLSLIPIIWVLFPTIIIDLLKNNAYHEILGVGGIDILFIYILYVLSDFSLCKFKLVVEKSRYLIVARLMEDNYDMDFYLIIVIFQPIFYKVLFLCLYFILFPYIYSYFYNGYFKPFF